ncbi:YbaN family protein [Lutimaribacter sp. EGI FJ00015]|uniref:YbaN family protein n=1 Tax=Lutimaribacter degradans TaxID=2945989 RepID=A0ACC5ZWN6_9RHOB|nr:YbaN family protein [Lutimaribacter sp. EGI FJ00013]MCM2561969.1 YbaN family protein [Lutimaribacter sp. EGI FJ00013]MCO0612999.1 YbaN family protein [Lutimaribacter sp. EGI FJ00015]MCO0635801.1 YbaN family protein [Lutimaribacter sp. EGI FJ00014]
MRFVWASLGLLSVACGLIGIFLPLVPTVPFLLLAAILFARSSERLHGWLLEHPTLGPPITDWQERGAISLRGKRAATLSIIAVFGLSVWMNLGWQLLLIQGLVLTAVLTFIWSRPSG